MTVKNETTHEWSSAADGALQHRKAEMVKTMHSNEEP